MKTIALWVLLLISCYGFAQVEDFEMDFIMQNWLLGHDNPAVVGCVVKSDGILWMDAYGDANAEEDIDATVDTPFMIASVSKTYTATALLRLLGQGQVNPNDDVDSFLDFNVDHPEFPEQPITVGHLLTHTAGIDDNWGVMPYCNGDCSDPLDEYLESYFTPGMENYNASANFHNWEPGSNYAYSNIGAALIGLLVEEIAGVPFNEYCETEIFTPMCMDNTHWFLSEFDDVDEIALPYETLFGDVTPLDHYGYPDYPDGQLRTSIRDMANWLIMQLNDGSFDWLEILAEPIANQAMAVQFEPDQGYIWYSFILDGDLVWGHNGGDQGVSADIIVSKENDLAVGIISNGDQWLTDLLEDTYAWAKTADASNLVWPSCATGISQPVTVQVSMFPNPCQGELSVVLNSRGQLTISSLEGKSVFRAPVQQGLNEINTSELNPGVYVLQINAGGDLSSQRLIIE